MNTSQAQEAEVASRLPPTPALKHILLGFLVPLIIALTGFYYAAMLIGLILIIVSIALTAGILMAAFRINHQKNLETEPPQWKTKTFPLTSLILIIGLSVIVFFIFLG